MGYHIPHKTSSEVIIGYRKWKVKKYILNMDIELNMNVDFVLTSLFYQEPPWKPGVPMIGIVDINKPSGVYAFNNYARSMSYMPNYINNNIIVFGKVSLWGKVICTELGYRAEYGYPKRLISINNNENLLNSLRRKYGIS